MDVHITPAKRRYYLDEAGMKIRLYPGDMLQAVDPKDVRFVYDDGEPEELVERPDA